MNTNEVAVLTGVSVRTLHHYDKIGLLSPGRNRDNDYREYTENDLDMLQQILFFKACGFSLAEIKMMLTSPSFDRDKAFVLQKKYLMHEKERIDAMLDTLEKTIRSWKGEQEMTQKEKFAGFVMGDNPYEEEARRLWGEEAVNEFNTKINSLSPREQNAVAENMEELFLELGKIRLEEPDSLVAQDAMNKMYQFFNKNFGYHYSLEAFAGLGELYVKDERFLKNIDHYGEGLSVFLSRAMKIYAENH
ncbi:MerR family transcriptional regulator [Lacrimispora algidixylanolytica]|uniref:MerR family transcriptional regulator n=1 Tax=Lacrimispora algidixylanolytica TaxID=94868 RepID=A0A419SYY6_9FIRM|nr:MerR family transcriptional regulator [Lacrimispora algidixylanolytica]RKD30348.1 MerR family transcriptional regulator [Lacrimispora algidixylanolytica]